MYIFLLQFKRYACSFACNVLKGGAIFLTLLQSLQAGWITSRQIEAAVFLCKKLVINFLY